MTSKFLLCFCFLFCLPLMFVERQEAIYISFVFMYVLRAKEMFEDTTDVTKSRISKEERKTAQWPKKDKRS
jgi:hypothetical protein